MPAGEARLARDRAVAVDLSGVLAAGVATRDRRAEITGTVAGQITAEPVGEPGPEDRL